MGRDSAHAVRQAQRLRFYQHCLCDPAPTATGAWAPDTPAITAPRGLDRRPSDRGPLTRPRPGGPAPDLGAQPPAAPRAARPREARRSARRPRPPERAHAPTRGTQGAPRARDARRGGARSARPRRTDRRASAWSVPGLAFADYSASLIHSRNYTPFRKAATPVATAIAAPTRPAGASVRATDARAVPIIGAPGARQGRPARIATYGHAGRGRAGGGGRVHGACQRRPTGGAARHAACYARAGAGRETRGAPRNAGRKKLSTHPLTPARPMLHSTH